MNSRGGARVVLMEAPGRLSVVPVNVPEPEAGEVLVRVAWAGICGSDRDLLEGTRPAAFVSYPVVPGHEWSGTIEAVGPGVDAALVGRKAVAEGFRACGTCAACRRGETTMCAADYDETGFTRPGAWADFLTVPARLVHTLPEASDLRAAALLEPAACVAEASLRASVLPGERVAVVGAGTLGLLATQLMRAAGAAEVVVFNDTPGREALARRCGASAFVTVDDATEAEQGFDVVIEAAGATGTAQLALDLTRAGGRTVLTGIPAEFNDSLGVQSLVTRQLAVLSVFGASSRAWDHAVRAFAAGILEPSCLITHEFALDDVADALTVSADRDNEVVKVLLRP